MYIDNYNKISNSEDKQPSSTTSEPEDLDNLLIDDNNGSQINSQGLGKLKGDLNNDNEVDSEDLQLLKDFLDGKRDLNDEQKANADMNGDNVIDKKDYALFVYALSEGNALKDKLLELQSLYVNLIGQRTSAKEVLGVDNSEINSVQLEIDITKSKITTLDSIIQ